MRALRRRLGVAMVAASLIALVASTTAASATAPDVTGTDATAAVASTGDRVSLPLPYELTAGSVSDALASVSADWIRMAAGTDSTVPLTLITGDRIEVGLDRSGRPVIREVDPAPRADGSPVVFHTITRDDRVYVVPNDALSLLGSDVLDWELFNLAALAERAALGDVGEVPVIVTQRGTASRRAASLPGAEVEATFESINATAQVIDGDGTWWREVQEASADEAGPAVARTGPLSGVEKIWLDQAVHVALADSVPQIGTGTAWARGLDGTGVTVAVLDTGIDADHPDVADRVVGTADFTGAGGAADGNGHGTHVAATIAGSGAASNGLRRGVAPGADLLVGKVLNDSGSGTWQSVMAGMEWAATSGAKIVSMSLGSGPTDGTDPVSQLVNQLTHEHGVLFVVAAGNSGPRPYSVGAPGAADEALTVAAVDKNDEMADFSGRGPRVGDDAPKPDIAAPGVAIVAARAEGTALGPVIDEYYTMISGTSMATPHVSGAAAIVAQQHPDLSGPEIKSLLMSSALDLGHDLYAQGAGRVDISRAVDPTVFSDGNVNFGRFTYPHHPVSDTITYSNVTDEPVTLSLEASLTAHDGTPAPEGMLTLDTTEVTVPAHGTVDVTVTLDGSLLEEGDVFGPYRGAVVAFDETGTQRASSRVSAFLEPVRYEVTVQITPPDGATSVRFGNTVVAPMDAQVALHDDPLTAHGAAEFTAELFPGTYTVHSVVSWRDAGGNEHVALPTAPQVDVTGPTTVRLDLNQAERVGVEVDEPTETYSARLRLASTSVTGTWQVTSEVTTGYTDSAPGWWVLPTDPVSTGTFDYVHEQALVPPSVTMSVLGGGQPLPLQARYATPDVSVTIGEQMWEQDGVTYARQVKLPVPRFTRPTVASVVYAGSGSAEDLASVDVDGALVLLTPTDICDDRCDFSALRERVAAAADAGAVGVLVAGDSGRVDLGDPPGGTVECPDGPDSCPEVEPYAPVPVMSLPAAEATDLIDRLSRNRVTKALIRGDAEVPRAYALGIFDDQVPADPSPRFDKADLDRVEHRIHSDRPGETTVLHWSRIVPSGADTQLDLPSVTTQRTLTVYVGPKHPDAVDQFAVGTVELDAPFLGTPIVIRGTFTALPMETQEIVLTGSDTMSWNTGVTLPGAVTTVATPSGFAPSPAGIFCAGCREGNTFWPIMYVTGANGYRSNLLVGFVNDTGFGPFWLGAAGCEPPFCEIHLYDEDGDEYAETLFPVGFSIGADNPGERKVDR